MHIFADFIISKSKKRFCPLSLRERARERARERETLLRLCTKPKHFPSP